MAALKHHLSRALDARRAREHAHLAETRRQHHLEHTRRVTAEAAAAAGSVSAAATSPQRPGGNQ